MKINHYQCKIDWYIYKICKPHSNYKAEPTIDKLKVKLRESRHIKMKNYYQFTKESSKRRGKDKGTAKHPENNKMSLVSPHLISKSSKNNL